MATQADYDRLSAWAVMLNQDANIDRHDRSRTVSMDVLSLGFSRTGTLSMQEALGILGYKTYHYSSIFANVQDADIWNDLFDKKNNNKGTVTRKDLDQVLGDYSAVTDSPCVEFWKELLEAYPDAKVILVERDEQKWHKSIGVVFEGVLNPVGTYVLRFTDPFWFGKIINCGRGWIEAFTGTTNLRKAIDNAPAAYRKHNANIRAIVPRDRLLECRLGDGWEPLCKFLGKPVPNVPFPHRNEAATLENAFGAALAKAGKNSLFNIAIVVGLGVVVGTLVRRMAA